MKRNQRFRNCLAASVAVIALVAGLASAQSPAAKPALPLEGKLVQLAAGPALRLKGKTYPHSSVRTWHLHTRQDKRLAGREIRVEGAWAPDGSLQVSEFYTVKGGKHYRVRYYCNICNIESLEPGDCVCCQAPTELQEIPL